MDRREFSVEAARFLLGGAALVITGCGGGGGSVTGPTTSAAPVSDAAGTIATNHGHAVTISAAQLLAGGALEIEIQGTSSHPHTVSLTSGEVVAVRSGVRVSKESTGNSHTHTVTFNA